MTSQHPQPTMRRVAALLAIGAFTAAQAVAAMCACRLQDSLHPAAPASIAVSSCCARHAVNVVPASDGCHIAAESMPTDDDCPGCTCSTPLPAATLAASATPDLESPNTLHFAALSTPPSIDLASAAVTTIDLGPSGSPPGLRLHALLCVWRN
jgi:hypothetical protein